MMRSLDTDDLRLIVTDPGELAKGARVLEEGGLANLARHGDRLYADASGMMASPYKVQITVGDRVTARCTCMAARTRPFCKHAAALLVAWSRAPEAFAEAERPPPGAEREPKRRRSIRKGKLDDAGLMGDGAARVIALVRELAVTGVASVGAGRAPALHGLAESLRAGKLRRLAGRVHRLADLLEAAGAGGRLDAEDYADLLVDLLLTARRVEKHVAGDALEPRHVEELIGKTWTKKDRAAIDDLLLAEIGHRQWDTPDGFVVREIRYVDLATARHFTDKQIVPAFMARRTPAKPSLGGRAADGAGGSLYPGYEPRRIDLERRGAMRDLDGELLDRLVAAALPGAAAALAAFQEHRRDVFAPDALPVTVRVDAVAAGGPRLHAVDETGEALHLPEDPLVEDQLAGALRGTSLRAVVGEITLDRALPVLVPRALVTASGLARLTVAAEITAPSKRGQHKKTRKRTGVDVDAGDWASQARAAGASSAAVALAEVRGEIADRLAQGVGSFTDRVVEPLAARLRELGLERPAQLVLGLAARPEAERLEDVVRVHQVLGVALIRVVGTTRIDRAAMVAVPGCPSVLVPRPARPLSLDEVDAARAAGAGPEIDRWTALVHAGAALAAVPPAELARAILPWWAHAWLSPLVADAVAREDGVVEVAREVLAETSRAGRAARMTAIRILVAADAEGAARHVAQVLGRKGDPTLGAFALELIDAVRERQGDREAAGYRRDRRLRAADLIRTLAHAGTADDRRVAAFALGDVVDDAGAAALRQAWLVDPSEDVREAAAISLGRRCEPESIDGFVRALATRDDDRRARAAALALGQAGDIRGARVLVEALAAGWRPALVADCVRRAGRVVLPALRAALAANPALKKRKSFKDTLAEIEGRTP